MAIITATDLNAQLDYCAQLYLKALGTAATGYGLGTSALAYGAGQSVASLKTGWAAVSDLDVSRMLAGALDQIEEKVTASRFTKDLLAPLLRAITIIVQRGGISGVSSIDAYLEYLNTGTGTKWQALQPPNWRDVYYAWKSEYPTVHNVYYEVLQGATYVNGLGKFEVSGAGAGVYTDQANAGDLVTEDGSTGSIDTSKYCGGFPQVRVSGLTGTGTVTVTGIGFDPATEAKTTSKTWTAAVTGNGVTACVVGTAPVDSLIVNCTNVSVAAGISAGTIYVEAARPTGRPLIS